MEKIPIIIDKSWHQYLQPLFDDPKMNKIRDEILPKAKFFPEGKNIFRVFQMPIDKIKVVVLGQDPYPSPGEAIGFAFAVSRHTKVPPSLRMIKNEILNSKTERDSTVNIESDIWNELIHWKNQGVFLLNTGLTVEIKAAGSHVNYWYWFTKEVISIIAKRAKPVWMLWGAKAQGFLGLITNDAKHEVIPLKATKEKIIETIPNIGIDRNYVIMCDHPAAELYGRTSLTSFSGSNTFNLCNWVLKAQKKTIINW